MTNELVIGSAWLLAVVLAFTSAGAFAHRAWPERTGDKRPQRLSLSPEVDVPVSFATASAAPRIWRAPLQRQEGEAEWRYDLFTPPSIFYDDQTRTFTLAKPPAAPGKTPPASFGLEFLGVKHEPFRLQLIGHVGEGPDARGVFENRVSGEIFLGAAGQEVPELALRIEAFAVRRESVEIPDSMTTEQTVARATICEPGSSQPITLSERERAVAGDVVALVVGKNGDAAKRVRRGETLQIGAATFRIGEISANPPTLEVFRLGGPGAPAERRVLLPVAPNPEDVLVP